MPSVQSLAGMGRRGDTAIAHLTPGERIVPDSIATMYPGLIASIEEALRRKGMDPSRFIVGSSQGPVNPATGLEEFYDSGDTGAGMGEPGGPAADAGGLGDTGAGIGEPGFSGSVYGGEFGGGSGNTSGSTAHGQGIGTGSEADAQAFADSANAQAFADAQAAANAQATTTSMGGGPEGTGSIGPEGVPGPGPATSDPGPGLGNLAQQMALAEPDPPGYSEPGPPGPAQSPYGPTTVEVNQGLFSEPDPPGMMNDPDAESPGFGRAPDNTKDRALATAINTLLGFIPGIGSIAGPANTLAGLFDKSLGQMVTGQAPFGVSDIGNIAGDLGGEETSFSGMDQPGFAGQDVGGGASEGLSQTTGFDYGTPPIPTRTLPPEEAQRLLAEFGLGNDPFQARSQIANMALNSNDTQWRSPEAGRLWEHLVSQSYSEDQGIQDIERQYMAEVLGFGGQTYDTGESDVLASLGKEHRLPGEEKEESGGRYELPDPSRSFDVWRGGKREKTADQIRKLLTPSGERFGVGGEYGKEPSYKWKPNVPAYGGYDDRFYV